MSFQADETLEAELVFLVDYSNRTFFVTVSCATFSLQPWIYTAMGREDWALQKGVGAPLCRSIGEAEHLSAVRWL